MKGVKKIMWLIKLLILFVIHYMGMFFICSMVWIKCGLAFTEVALLCILGIAFLLEMLVCRWLVRFE